MSNTVGSQEVVPLVLRAKKNLVLTLTQEEFEVLLGSLLGDGYITKLGRVQIEQGKSQRAYLEWKYKMLARVVNTSILVTKREKTPGKITESYRFWTKQYFRSWRNLFYPSGKKVIPAGIGQLLSPLVLAVWFMDDGFLREKKAIEIATEKFSGHDLNRIRHTLLARFGIETSVTRRGRLYFGKQQMIKFVSVIEPYIVAEMRYKLP